MSKRKNQRNVLLWVGIGVSFIWIVQILYGFVPLVDQLLNEFVYILEGTYIYTLFRFITDFGSREFLIPFVFILSILFLLLYRSFLPALFFAGGTLGTHLLNQLIKLLVERERPSLLEEANAIGYSFPSGHAMISIVCYGLFFYFVSQKIKQKQIRRALQVFTVLLVFLIGISRYVIHVHYMTDVVAGFVIGGLLLTLFIYVYEQLETEEKEKARSAR